MSIILDQNKNQDIEQLPIININNLNNINNNHRSDNAKLTQFVLSSSSAINMKKEIKLIDKILDN